MPDMPDEKDHPIAPKPSPLEEGSVSEPNDLLFKGGLVEDADVVKFLQSSGYTLEVTALNLPTQPVPGFDIEGHVAAVLAHVDLSEFEAVREFIALPLLFATVRSTGGRIERFVPRAVENELNALLDYRVAGDDVRLIVETRYTDLERGALRLAGQMAVAHIHELSQDPPDARPLFGVLTTGGAWRFMALTFSDEDKRITRDLNLYGVPPNARQVVEHLAGILAGAAEPGE